MIRTWVSQSFWAVLCSSPQISTKNEAIILLRNLEPCTGHHLSYHVAFPYTRKETILIRLGRMVTNKELWIQKTSIPSDTQFSHKRSLASVWFFYTFPMCSCMLFVLCLNTLSIFFSYWRPVQEAKVYREDLLQRGLTFSKTSVWLLIVSSILSEYTIHVDFIPDISYV